MFRSVGPFARRRVTPSVLACGVLVAMGGPDLDVLFPFLGLRGWIFQHRAFTHSVFGGAAWACLLAAGFWGVARIANRKPGPFREYALAAVMGAWIHILGDWATSYGTPLLWPFSRKEFSLDLVTNLDLFYGLTLGGALVVAAELARRGRAVAGEASRAGHASAIRLTSFAAALLYVGVGFWGREAALRDGAVASFPAFESPAVRRLVYPEGTGYRLVRRNLVTGGEWSRHVDLRPDYGDPVVRSSAEAPEVKRLLKHARFPVIRIRREGDGTTVWWTDLLFTRGRWVAAAAFVRLDGRDRVATSGSAFEFW